MIYTSFVIFLSILIFIFGWIFYRNPTPLHTLSLSSSINNTISYTNDNKKLVSIIIPIYNQKKLIEQVIHSIFNSTYKNIEVIAVNDGSTDGTDKILDYLNAEKYPKLKVIHKSNGGKRKAVSSGFIKSQGQYIILMDSDSIVNNNAIAEFVKVFDSDSSIGSAAGHAKIWNSNTNFITKCQDAWYDHEFNIYKTCESYFETVTCCSGCLAGYRREAIEGVMLVWESKNTDFNNINSDYFSLGSKKHVNKIKAFISSYSFSFNNKLLMSLLSYDDSEDRALTTFCLKRWKSVYISTAFVYTEAPDNIKDFTRQQQRWKKGYLRANLFASTFFIAKKNPVLSILFYAGFIMSFISPIITPLALLYGMFVLHEMMAPLSLIGGFLAIGFLEGIDYKMRDRNSKNWMYKPIMNLILSFMLSWLIFAALINYRKNVWLTR
jgi:hyaluronan synthase